MFNALIDLASSLEAAWEFLVILIYGYGAYLVYVALVGFVKSGKGGGDGSWSNLIWGFVFCGGGYVLQGSVAIFGGVEAEVNPFAYVPTNDAGQGVLTVVQSVLMLCKFMGYWFIFKGYMVFKSISDGENGKSHHDVFAGLTHLIAGALVVRWCSPNGWFSSMLIGG